MQEVSIAQVLGKRTWNHLNILDAIPQRNTKVVQMAHQPFSEFSKFKIFSSDYFNTKLKILDSGPRELYELTGCKSSCSMPKFSATIQEHVVQHDVAQSQVQNIDIRGSAK